ncbi:MAG: hypothetical protein JW810_02680 [Sedimentisphaerales bacterium]|nr:hypothetical protein [Sedimentisphaerales bacterium]
MARKLSTRDKRALAVGMCGVAVMLLYAYVYHPWQARWLELKDQVVQQELLREKLGLSTSAKATMQQALLAGQVPRFEMPQQEDTQRLIFERRFVEQLKKAGLNAVSMPVYQAQVRPLIPLGAKELRLHWEGKCKYDQALKLLATLYENPYLMSVEEFELQCGEKKREEMQITLTVSTLVL